MIFAPIAAWMAISNCWRGISSFSFSHMRRPNPTELSTCVRVLSASTDSPFSNMSSFTNLDSRKSCNDSRTRHSLWICFSTYRRSQSRSRPMEYQNQFDTIARNKFLLDKLAALAQTKRHNRADKIRCRNNRCSDIWFFYLFNRCRIGQSRRIMHFCHIAFLSYTLYDTFGTVVMTSMSNSRPNRSCTISM